MTGVLIRNVKRQDYKRTTRLWGHCPTCGCTWQWNGHTANADNGMTFINESRCMCNWWSCEAWNCDGDGISHQGTSYRGYNPEKQYAPCGRPCLRDGGQNA